MAGDVIILLADGYEEIEAITTIDILRRLEIKVIIVGIDHYEVIGAHNISIRADILLHEIKLNEIVAIVLPGGLPGAENLKKCESVIKLVQSSYQAGKIIAAICAAPIVLSQAGIIHQKTVTCYPGFESELTGARCTSNEIEWDNQIITGKGPGVSIDFALTIGKALRKKEDEIKKLAQAMIHKYK